MYAKEETDADDLVVIQRISIMVYAAVDADWFKSFRDFHGDVDGLEDEPGYGGTLEAALGHGLNDFA